MNQMAARNERAPGSLPSNTERNPGHNQREEVKAIMLRSGKWIEEPKMADEPKVTQRVRKRKNAIEEEDVPRETINFDSPQEVNEGDDQEGSSEEHKMAKERAEDKPAKCKMVRESIAEPNRWAPPPPYPYDIKKREFDAQFAKCLEAFKKLELKVPFLDVICESRSYAEYLKEILSKKKKWDKFETIHLSKNCSAILLNKLPPKQKDPGNFTLTCQIGPLAPTKSLCDLGASINLMPLSVFRKLGLGDEPPPTTISLQLADRSVTYPRGLIEDLLVKVGEFVFPADFIVLDMVEDRKIPIILGRPF